MVHMYGQLNLISKIFSYDYENFPQTIIFEGSYGCGKHTLVNMISEEFNVDYVDISSKLDTDFILDSYLNTNKIIYCVDINSINTFKQSTLLQNSMLKFIEEPPKDSKIILLCEQINQLLPTVINRCTTFKFEPYNKSDLEFFAHDNNIEIENKDVYTYFDTPGLLLKYSNANINDIVSLCDTIISKINVASIPNCLTIVEKINFSDDVSKFDLIIFIRILEKLLLDKMNENFNINDYIKFIKMYKITKSFENSIKNNNVNRKNEFQKYLIELKQVG